MPKQQIIAASDARNNFSDLISKVQYQNQVFLVERYGEVVAKIVPVQTDENDGVEGAKEVTQQQQQKSQIAQNDESNNSQEQLEEKPRAEFLSKIAAQSSYRQVSAMGRTTSMPPRIVRDEQIEQKDQDEPTQPKRDNDSGWSALKKLEELIAAQKAKSEVERQSVQSHSTPTSLSDRLRWGASINRNPVLNEQEDIEDDQNEQMEIIRKKIDL